MHGTSDSFPSMEDPPNLTNRDLALSLDNINNNMGKMAGLLAKLCEKPAPDERPQGLKRQSTSGYRIIRTLSLKKTLTSRANDGVILVPRMIMLVFTPVMIWTTQMILKCSPSAQRPPAKTSGKSPPSRHSSYKTLRKALTRMTPPATNSSKSWLVLL